MNKQINKLILLHMQWKKKKRKTQAIVAYSNFTSCSWTGLENMSWKMKSWCQWSKNFANDSPAARFFQSNEILKEAEKSVKDAIIWITAKHELQQAFEEIIES